MPPTSTARPRTAGATSSRKPIEHLFAMARGAGAPSTGSGLPVAAHVGGALFVAGAIG